jgi:hypothetical protein
MQKNAGLRGGSANAHPNQKMGGEDRQFFKGSLKAMRQLKKSSNKKSRQYGHREERNGHPAADDY